MKAVLKGVFLLAAATMTLGCGGESVTATGIVGTWARSSTREYQCTPASYDQPENPTCLGGGPCPTYVFTADNKFTYTNPSNGDSRSGTYTYLNDRIGLTDQTGSVEFRVALTTNTLSFLTTADHPLYVCVMETKYTRK